MLRFLPFLTGAVLLLIAGCAEEAPRTGAAIIDQAQQQHGTDLLDEARASFVFRGDTFVVDRSGGSFKFVRETTDSLGLHERLVMEGDTAYKHLDGRSVAITDSARQAIKTTLNSVVYFAFLPYKLDDPAVQARLLGRTTIRDTLYNRVEVTFAQEGGGRDYEDRFIYWFDADNHTLRYLAYRYHTDGGGTRFRRAINHRRTGGVLVADYINYTSETIDTTLVNYEGLVGEEALEEVSRIILEDVSIKPGRSR